jgi:nucleotide-binding universal stress UspA family protein
MTTRSAPSARPQRTVLIGYDGSDNSEDGLALGGLLTEVLGATAVVAIVLRYPEHLMDRSSVEAAVRSEATPRLAVALDRLRDLPAETRAIVDDSPGRVLHELAEEERPLAIAIGSCHRGPAGRVLIGSVGETLLSGAPCAIAVAPRGYAARLERRLQRISVAVNGAPEAWTALRAAVSITERLHASLRVVAVAELPPFGYAAPLAIGAESYQRLEEKEKEQVLDDATRDIPDLVPVERVLRHGEPADEIVAAAEDSDLLVMGSRGYGPIRRALLGGVSSKVVRSASCPVLVLPRSAGEDPIGFDAGASR